MPEFNHCLNYDFIIEVKLALPPQELASNAVAMIVSSGLSSAFTIHVSSFSRIEGCQSESEETFIVATSKKQVCA